MFCRALIRRKARMEKENSHFTMWIVDSRVKQRFIFASFLLLCRAMLFRFNICPLACSHLMSHFVDVRTRCTNSFSCEFFFRNQSVDGAFIISHFISLMKNSNQRKYFLPSYEVVKIELPLDEAPFAAFVN